MDSIPGGSANTEIRITRRTLINYYRECSSRHEQDKIVYLQDKVQNILKVTHLTNDIKGYLRRLTSDYKAKLLQAHRNFIRCINGNKTWFDTNITPSVKTSAENRSVYGARGGRPTKNFGECTERTKRRKTEDIRKKFEPQELAFAAQVEYRARGDIHTAKIIKEIVDQGSTENVEATHATLSADKALSLLIEAQLTKFQYNTMRSAAIETNCNLYPNYETVTEAKKRSYPTGIVCTESSAEVPLQNLMDHTAHRLLLSLSKVLESLTKDQLKHLCLKSKWGCDGSGSHSEYKQKFENMESSDAFMIITSIVPIQLISCESGTTTVIWQNPRPSSPRYCRPLKLQMAHETAELSRCEAQNFQVQLDSLAPSNIQMVEECIVQHQLTMTMVDEKMINALTNTSSAQRFYICGATSKYFNRLKFCMEKPIIEKYFTYGISSLHAWIRFTECILHLSYKLRVAKWQVRKVDEKEIVATEKRRIQTELWEKLGIHVDKPRQGGGTSTDGNTARKFFQNAEEVSEITGVNLNIIKRLYTILKVMSSGFQINSGKFKSYCDKTAATFVMQYPWFYMPTSLHKVLIHGPKIIESSELAIGLMSEDAQESRNKDVRKYREQFSRKFSRKLAMEDTYHRLMVSSDPYITGLRKLVPKKLILLSPTTLNLLDEPTIE